MLSKHFEHLPEIANDAGGKDRLALALADNHQAGDAIATLRDLLATASPNYENQPVPQKKALMRMTPHQVMKMKAPTRIIRQQVTKTKPLTRTRPSRIPETATVMRTVPSLKAVRQDLDL
jgi:hypothetical protein